ncbi:neuropeptide FF receptor 1 [Aplysia californica]|uniref:Neuropeptide FF receptor 1 n=1 Tax=Aplysia californica TaxID=6500 RepID=A0ABM1VT93_APLCA|nr:neuropeptide FF receptor 1 [Aplysia californica]XP_035825636.1 neuropeptide FF receptor 1 [Aplysia californica]
MLNMSPEDNFTMNGTGMMPPVIDRWGWLTKIFLSHIIVAVGLVANVFTFIVMKTPRLRYKSYSHYLSALAVFDSLVLIGQEVHMVHEILQHLDEPGLFGAFSHSACKVFTFAQAVCNLMSSWLIVAMAIERMCVVYMPFRRNMWCQQRGAVIIILTLFFFMSCTQIFRFALVENKDGECVGADEHSGVYLPLHIYVYQFALLFIAPVLIVLVCNIAVLIKIFSVEKATQNEDSSSTRLTGSARRRSKTTRMLVAISLTYIVTTLPLVVLTITVYVLTLKVKGNPALAVTLYGTVPWLHFLQAVTNLNYASNFFIYILSGKKFRIELRRVFVSDRRGNSFMGGSSRTRDEIIMM